MLNIVYSRNCVYQTAYHMVWCPQYRKSVLRGGVAQSLRELLESICAERKYEILSLEIQPDHLHLFVSFPPSVSIADAVRVLKGASARMLLMRHPELKNELWAGHSERCRRATDGSQRLNGLNAGSFQRSDEDRSPTLHQRRPVRGTEAPFDTGRRKSQRRGIGG